MLFTSDEPVERARQCREQAETCTDSVTAEFFRRLADDYEEIARRLAEDDSSS
jgi:hypothetical protein